MNVKNLCMFTGNLTSDAAIGGNAEYPNIKLRIAVNSGSKKSPKTLYIDCVYWTKFPDNILAYLKTGKQVQVGGSLETEEWTDKTSGQARSKNFLNTEDLQLLGGGKQEEVDGEAPKTAKGKGKAKSDETPVVTAEVPF